MSTSGSTSSSIWSSELASRLPGTPVREGTGTSRLPGLPGTPVREGQQNIINSQPMSSSITPPSSKSSNISLSQDMTQHFNELNLLLELKLLSEDPVPGVFLLPSNKSLLEWHGILFLHNGPWKGGIFRFTLYIPDEFPQMRPMIRFKTDVYHPYIHSHNGAMNMLQVLPHWKARSHHIRDVIVSMRECFFREEFWSSSNKEEEILIKEKIRTCVLQSTKQSQDNGDPDNVFNFTDESDDNILIKARQLLHEGELPSQEGGVDNNTTGIMNTLTAGFSRFIDVVIGQ